MTALTKPNITAPPACSCAPDGAMARIALEYPDIDQWCYAQPITILAWRDTFDGAPVLHARGGASGTDRALLRLVIDPDAALLSLAAIAVEREDDDQAIDGNAGDEEAATWVRDQVAQGNEWAWCQVRVHVDAFGFRGSSSWLGGCSYGSEAAFRQPGSYFDDLTREALADLRAQIEAAGAVVDAARRVERRR